MNRFWKLLNWEINRFSKLYAVILLAILVLQVVGILTYSIGYMSRATSIMNERFLSASQYIQNYGEATFQGYSNDSVFFSAPIALGAVMLVLYVFLIWYKEWFGRNTFVYRLLMLPTSRMNLYLAKLTAIMLFVLGLVAFQLFILQLEILVFKTIVSSEFRYPVAIIELIARNMLLKLIYPVHFIKFLFFYGLGIMSIIVVFTLILLERSFRLKGIGAAILYASLVVFLVLLPFLITDFWSPNYFYAVEFFWMEVAVVILIISGSLWFSSFLINKKVTV
jgi:hypothetical protein